ncbi:YihY/virulence factor BrkB family protein [Aeromicrobium sp.]|uniref:YihY/virulence factor BrkB family protein n=1 Tax=Aeromicrobium sp. TaxID=1871063 RepID=UPI003D6C0247
MPSPRRTALGAWKQASAKQAPLLAAGVAFYAFLSLFPAMIAGVLAYGLFADPLTVARQSDRIAETLPADAATLITDQMEALTTTESRSLSIGLVVAIALALYGASAGVGNLITAVNTMFGFEETRGFVKRKLIAFGLTLGAIAFLAVMLTLVAVTPVFLDAVVDVPGLRMGLEAGRWLLLLGAIVVSIGILLRVAPDRPDDPPRLVGKGVLIASAMWVLVSVGFSFYVDNFGRYGETYGALAGVVVLQLWLWIGIYALLLGSAVEAVRENALRPAETAETAGAQERSQE